MLEEGRTCPRVGMVRNERKAAVLGLLLRDGSVTTRDLVHRWELSYSGAQAFPRTTAFRFLTVITGVIVVNGQPTLDRR